jgi:hypothetical protein
MNIPRNHNCVQQITVQISSWILTVNVLFELIIIASFVINVLLTKNEQHL